MRRKSQPFMDPIRRGSTPTLIFPHHYDLEIVVGGYIVFSQRGEFLFRKEFSEDSVTVDPQRVLVDLSRQETLKLTTVDVCRAQICFFLESEKAAQSGIYKIPVLETLEGGED